MKKFWSIVLVAVLFMAPSAYADEFSKVRCDADIAKALIGQKVSIGPVVKTEDNHKELGLKDTGGTEISDTLFVGSWKICGREYMLLEDASVRDVLLFPPHSIDMPGFIGTCKLKNKDYKYPIVAVLIRKKDRNEFPASVAWKIDEKAKKFTQIPVEGLRCPSMYVFTEDGGS